MNLVYPRDVLIDFCGTSQNENLVHKEPLTRREVLIIVEELYNFILNVEQVKRNQPLPEEEQERHDAWWAYRLTLNSVLMLRIGQATGVQCSHGQSLG